MTEDDLIQPERPNSFGLLTNSDVLLGPPIPAIDRLKIFSSEDFENLVREWIAGYCEKKYAKVWRAGGAKDRGRDVVAFVNNFGVWDNYQCKHYDHPLMSSDIWLELGKLCYYTFIKSYSLPRKYYFVAPQGVGPTVGDLLLNSQELKDNLLIAWEKVCKSGITKISEIPLSDELKKHIESINFSIFTFLDPQELIEQHKKTNYYTSRFGGGLQRRNNPEIKSFKQEEYSLRFVEHRTY